MTQVSSEAFLNLLARRGVTRLSGVPCSSMTGLINLASGGAPIPYANAPNEGEALAYSAGAWLGGGLGATLFQNSGLGNLFNALTSLIFPYRIPVLMLCGWRGEPGSNDEPQHAAMGALSGPLLEKTCARVSTIHASADISALAAELEGLSDGREARALLVSAGAFDSSPDLSPAPVLPPPATSQAERHSEAARVDCSAALRTIVERLPEQAGVVATTGYIGRAYWAISDSPRGFCMAGSMGHASAIALGAAVQSGRPMLVIDGDGAILMRPSGAAMVGSMGPAHFSHLVLDNGVHASTGGQRSLSASVDLAGMASAFGYRRALDTNDPDHAASVLLEGLEGRGPTFVRLRVLETGPTPPRVRTPLDEIAARFRSFLSQPCRP
jgi:phosphonopyruvate decarboxylase